MDSRTYYAVVGCNWHESTPPRAMFAERTEAEVYLTYLRQKMPGYCFQVETRTLDVRIALELGVTATADGEGGA